jgi:hypothetical protein
MDSLGGPAHDRHRIDGAGRSAVGAAEEPPPKAARHQKNHGEDGDTDFFHKNYLPASKLSDAVTGSFLSSAAEGFTSMRSAGICPAPLSSATMA